MTEPGQAHEPHQKRGYTVQEAAVYIGRSVSYVRQLKRENRLPARRDGKLLMFLREDLDAFLDSLPDAD